MSATLMMMLARIIPEETKINLMKTLRKQWLKWNKPQEYMKEWIQRAPEKLKSVPYEINYYGKKNNHIKG